MNFSIYVSQNSWEVLHSVTADQCAFSAPECSERPPGRIVRSVSYFRGMMKGQGGMAFWCCFKKMFEHISFLALLL